MISFKPNDEQINCIKTISTFLKEYKPYSKLLINGSAGTGKTTIIISTLVKLLINQIKLILPELIIEIQNNNYLKLECVKKIDTFIITAPTNKAKDILVNKYNSYIESLVLSDIQESNNETINKYNNTDINKKQNETLLKQIIIILSKKISFLTVSQLLSISRVINEMGEEEFTKGNEKKISDKYNKDTYSTTSIIIDECSMIDTNTTKLLNVIKCPIIYIGDYCQLPPVNEVISPTFEIEKLSLTNPSINTTQITLKTVERCKNDITLIANALRNKIYKTIPSFNLLENNAGNIILYNKKFGSWVRTYVKDIKSKQKDLKLIRKTIKSDKTLNESELLEKEKELEKEIEQNELTIQKNKNGGQVFDTMALGWTNKCCMLLNDKIRTHLFEDIENIETIYIIKGDKLLVKSPYYKYNNHLFSSSIVYVANVKKVVYKPLSFKEWCNIIINIKNDSNDKTIENKTLFDIDIKSMLNDTLKVNDQNHKDVKNVKNIDDYFKMVIKSNKIDSDQKQDDGDSKGNGVSNGDSKCDKTDKEIIEEARDLLLYRNLFYLHHNLNERTNNGNYEFTDELSLKYNLLIPNYDIHNLYKISSNYVKTSIYTKWHTLMSIKLFGIPNDSIGCKKCSFFLNKFIKQLHTSVYINDFIDATDNLEFDMNLCDLVSFNSSGKTISKNIPILNMNNESNIENIKKLRNIIKNSYEVKLLLSKNEEKELNSINKMLNEEGESTDSSTKYVTLSQLFGHYMSHVITSCYPEIDYGYALTVHKSQGSTYDDVYIEYANILSNTRENEKLKLLYTAITRSSNKLHIFY